MLVTSVRRIVEDFEREPPAPGDAYIVNDPYDGGTHLPDVTIVVPVFHEGTLVALSASMAHHQDIGGKSPGSTPPTPARSSPKGCGSRF
jgi:N-methylhydantoinase B